jgi:ABC-type transporter lipoprotein component MlaA
MIALGGGIGFTEFEARGAEMRALEQSSVDYYAALRSAYLQSRAAQLRSQDHYSQ